MPREEALTDLFVELADTLVNEFDVSVLLQTLTYRCADIFDVDAVGVLLENPHGFLQVAAASTDDMYTLELFQLQYDEGPCRDAFRSGRQVIAHDLDQAADRWPAFGPKARLAGFLSVHAFPLRLRDQVMGALNLFSKQAGPLTDADIHTVQALADVASIGIQQARTIDDAQTLSSQLQFALDSRTVIEQAKGILMQRQRVGPRDAFEVLRQYARNHNERLVDVARALIDETVPPESIS